MTVTVPLPELDLNQCPADLTVANAFKNSDRCDTRSSYVSTVQTFRIILIIHLFFLVCVSLIPLESFSVCQFWGDDLR